MKFLYEYRTSDNEKHSGAIRASDREAAYALLKKQGIKPSRFSEAPGVFNKLFGKGKRWIAIGVLGILCLALGVVFLRTWREAQSTKHEVGFLSSMDRRQPIGDAAIIDEGIRTGWADVFELEGERFLASFAIPGVPAGLRSTTEDEVKAALDRSGSGLRPSASIEARQIVAMVEGMKQELRQYLADGGTVVKYGERLVARQEYELSFYRRAKSQYETAKRDGAGEAELSKLLSELNVSLRKMGIRPLVAPRENF